MATKLTVPIPEEQIRALKVGDQVLLSGVIFTGRDAAHKYMVDNFVKGPCPDSEKAMYEVLKKGLVARRYRKVVKGLESEIHQLRNLPLAGTDSALALRADAEGEAGEGGGIASRST